MDVRILAATNKDMDIAVEEGNFRRDLYYRLNVLPFYIPPLRERPDDIPELADFFLIRINRETKKQIRGFTSESMDSLISYHWPGNVRELENVVERAVVICPEDFIRVQDLILDTSGMSGNDEYSGKQLKDAINLFKKHFIFRALETHGWRQTETAKLLGIQRTYLSRLIKELNIKRQ